MEHYRWFAGRREGAGLGGIYRDTKETFVGGDYGAGHGKAAQYKEIHQEWRRTSNSWVKDNLELDKTKSFYEAAVNNVFG